MNLEGILLSEISQVEKGRLCVCLLLSHVQLSVTPWTVARQASLSMGFSRQESWSGFPFPSPQVLYVNIYL